MKSRPGADQRRRIMQERFCKCGHKLKVQYTLDGFIPWEAVILKGDSAESPVKVCPCCGSYLSIHFLR
jgi:hypothetical protein